VQGDVAAAAGPHPPVPVNPVAAGPHPLAAADPPAGAQVHAQVHPPADRPQVPARRPRVHTPDRQQPGTSGTKTAPDPNHYVRI